MHNCLKTPDWFNDAFDKGVGVPGGISEDSRGNFYVWFDSIHHLMLDVNPGTLEILRELSLESGALERADNIETGDTRCLNAP